MGRLGPKILHSAREKDGALFDPACPCSLEVRFTSYAVLFTSLVYGAPGRVYIWRLARWEGSLQPSNIAL